MTGARHDWSMSYPIGPPTGGAPASYCSRDRADSLRLGTILIVTGALAPGILLFPSVGRPPLRWDLFSSNRDRRSRESFALHQSARALESESYCFRDRRDSFGLSILLFPSCPRSGTRWHSSYAKGERILPPMGSILFQFRGAHPTTASSILPLMLRAGHDWNPIVPIVPRYHGTLAFFFSRRDLRSRGHECPIGPPAGGTLHSLMKRHLPYE